MFLCEREPQPSPVKNCEGSRILLYSQDNKLTCYCFLDPGRRHESLTQRQRTLLFMAKVIARASYGFVSIFSLLSKIYSGTTGHITDAAVTLQETIAEVGKFTLFFSNLYYIFFHYHLVPLCPPPPSNPHTGVHVHESFFLFAHPLPLSSLH